MNRIITDTEANLAWTFAPENSAVHYNGSYYRTKSIRVEGVLEAILRKQADVSYAQGLIDGAKRKRDIKGRFIK